jgi:hypothetical protein
MLSTRQTDDWGWYRRVSEVSGMTTLWFDVFRMSNEEMVWIGATLTIEQAVERARKDMGSEDGRACDYLILDTRNGGRTIVTAEQIRREPG